jgi:hypothetical protein
MLPAREVVVLAMVTVLTEQVAEAQEDETARPWARA